ncbi:MAG: UDP-3-O-(3-hydroxymyristoyl)glucosamine N-acyltransferase [Halioglobus sp.]
MYLLGELATKLGLALVGRADRSIASLAPLSLAGPDSLSFMSSDKHLKELAKTSAGAVIVRPDYADQCPVDYLLSDDPYLSFAKATKLFDNSPVAPEGIHSSAIVSSDAQVDSSASLGPNVVVEPGAVIGPNVTLAANVYIGHGSVIGAGSRLMSSVVVYHDVHLGEYCLVQAQTVLGSDGFGYAPDASGWNKIHQLGGLRIGDRVEIGAGAAIDRGALENTVIADGVIIDNHVHIAHNCSIGKNTAIAACCAMAGSTKIGANCTFGGMVGIAGHIEICDDAHFTAMSMVTGSVTKPGSYSSGTGLAPTGEWRKNAVRFSKLDTMFRRLTKLEKNT